MLHIYNLLSTIFKNDAENELKMTPILYSFIHIKVFFRMADPEQSQ
jgi:hypothetical protein